MKNKYIETNDNNHKPWIKIIIFITALIIGIYGAIGRDAGIALVSITLCMIVFALRKAEMERNALWNSRSSAAIVFRVTSILAAIIWILQIISWLLGIISTENSIIALLIFYILMFICVGSTLFIPKAE